MELAVKLTANRGAAQPIVVVGLRGMGKTALLRRSIRNRDTKPIVLYAEGSEEQSLAASFRRSLERASGELRSAPDRLKSTLDSIVRKLPKASFELPHEMGAIAIEGNKVETGPKPFIDAIFELNEAAAKHDRFLAFVIDEIQTVRVEDLLPVVEFVHETAGTNTPALLLGAGLPNSRLHLHRVKTYTERWRYFRLELLSRDESRDAIDLPARERGVGIEEKALELLARESAGYPFFIQELGSAAWATRTGPSITAEQIRGIVPGVRRLLDSSLYEPSFESLTAPELSYAFAMAKLGPGPHRVGQIAAVLEAPVENLNWIRNQLIKKDVAYSPASGLLEFRLPLTERFLRRNARTLGRRVQSP
jgi:AAA+ ATPase superfamily predicted ATPase